MNDGKPMGVRMAREHLDDIPAVNLSQGFSFRFYRPGDEQRWLDIWQASEVVEEITAATFEQTYNVQNERQALMQRQIFVCNEQGDAVATSTSWMGENDRSCMEQGRVHWVAVIPAYQGKGLARPLLGRTLEILRDLGHTDAFLYSDTSRINALALYLKYGFRPCINRDEDQKAWAYVKGQLRGELANAVDGYLAQGDEPE